MGRFFPQALNIRDDVVGDGFMPNVETLAALDPDIVFQWGSWGEDIITPIRNAGLRVALFQYGTQEYLEGWISMFGAVLGKEEKAQAILDWHHATRESLEKAVAEIPRKERPRVLYLLRYASGLKVSGRDTYNDFFHPPGGGRKCGKGCGSVRRGERGAAHPLGSRGNPSQRISKRELCRRTSIPTPNSPAFPR